MVSACVVQTCQHPQAGPGTAAFGVPSRPLYVSLALASASLVSLGARTRTARCPALGNLPPCVSECGSHLPVLATPSLG